MSGETASQVLDRVLAEGQGPRSITIMEQNSNPERSRIGSIGIGCNSILFGQGKPTENAFIESFNGRLRDECLNLYQFASLAEAQTIIEAWRAYHNHRRSHGSLGHLTSNEFVAQCQAQQTAEEVRCSG